MNLMSLIGLGTTLLTIMVSLNLNAGTQLKFRTITLNTDQASLESTDFKTMSVAGEKTKHFIIQFKNVIQPADRKWLDKQGEVLNYIPEDAYLVRLTSPIQKIKQHENVQAVVPFYSALKMSEGFGARNVFNANNNVRVLITVTKTDMLEKVKSKITHNVVYAEGKVLLVELPLGQLEQVAKIDGVQWLEPYEQPELMHIELKNPGFTFPDNDYSDVEPYYYVPMGLEDLTGYESGTTIMDFDTAWNRGYTGAYQIVAMADTGLDSGHLKTLHSDFSGTLAGQIFGKYAKDWGDPMGHGSHVAGSVMGNGSKSMGYIRGGAFNASMVAQGMWSPTWNNLSVPPDLKGMIMKAYNLGARIHTNSWGNGRRFGNYDSYAQQVDEFMWENPDMLILFAAGNSGQDMDHDGRIDPGSVSSPGTAKNVLTVGASENYLLQGGIQSPLGQLRAGAKKWGAEPLGSDTLSNNPNGIAAFSSRGPTNDGRLKPEVVAPGTNIVSLCSTVQGSSTLWGRFNQDYCYSGGTSMSTPLVAGAAAVVREYLQTGLNVPHPSAALVKAMLMGTADDLYPGQYGYRDQGQELLNPGPNNNQGFGRVNVKSATHDWRYLAIADHNTVSMTQNFETYVSTGGAEQIKVLLYYTDAPGAVNAQQTLVNDIDLEVVDVYGNIYQSNSRINNHEQLILHNMPGEYFTVRVKAHNLPVVNYDLLRFALVVTR